MNYDEFKLSAERKDAAANNVTHYFSQYFSSLTAFLFFRIGASPNAVTWLFLLTGCLAAMFLWLGSPLLSLLFWRLHIVIDMADGTLARATKRFSRSADGFDKSNHIVINTSTLFASTYFVNNEFVLLAVVISFYLSYFFSRNYYSEKRQTRRFSLAKNITKDVVGLEGYLFFTCVLMILDVSNLQIYLASLYALFFFVLYFIKLNFYINGK